MKTMTNHEEQFESDLRAAMSAEPASADLRHRVLAQAMPGNRRAANPGWLAAFDPRNWRMPVLVELGALAAAASLAIGVFAGASGFVLGTTTASADESGTIDLVALAYDDTSGSGDQP